MAAPGEYPLPLIQMQAGVKQFWRVVNATSQAFLKLEVQVAGAPQPVRLVAVDGVPLRQERTVTSLAIPPAGRAEFIVEGPPADSTASFQTIEFPTGKIGNQTPPQPLATIVSSEMPVNDLPTMPAASKRSDKNEYSGLLKARVTANRELYFSESNGGVNGPNDYYITVEGQRPRLFSPNEPPAIVTKIGAVEDWTVENRTLEAHAFHIHQTHFDVMALSGVPLLKPYLADTVTVPAWTGSGPYPSVTVRMDFRDPQIAGTFVYHCHILEHEDLGMMAKIEVDPQ